MTGALLMGLLLLVAVYFLIRWFIDAEPAQAWRVIKIVGIGAVIAVAAFFLVTGKIAYALYVLPALIPLLMRLRSAATTAKNFSRVWSAASGAPAGQASRVASRFLEMTLDHDTGDLDGRVVYGVHEGMALGDLDTAALVALLTRYRTEDPESARLLEAYLDRNRDGWRADAGADGGGQDRTGAGGAPGDAMTRDEAYAVLGLERGADDDAVRAAHRRLIATLHPDHGGSDYLAAKINQAKDVLLGA
jgi:hypothetical protein